MKLSKEEQERNLVRGFDEMMDVMSRVSELPLDQLTARYAAYMMVVDQELGQYGRHKVDSLHNLILCAVKEARG